MAQYLTPGIDYFIIMSIESLRGHEVLIKSEIWIKKK